MSDAASELGPGQWPRPPKKSATERPAKRPGGWSFTRPRRTATGETRNVQKDADVPSRQWQDWDSASCSSCSVHDGQNQKDVGALSNGRKRARTSASDSKTSREKRESDRFSKFSAGNNFFNTKGKVSKHDGRLHISINEAVNSGYMAKKLGSSIRKQLHSGKQDVAELVDELSPPGQVARPDIDKALKAEDRPLSGQGAPNVPRLNVVIMVIGSRGDVQPFIKIAKNLRDEYGHRVRLATHPVFRDFIEKESGLEFFSIGGDPSELMAFMVKNPGLIPSVESVRAGEIGKRRYAMFEMFHGMWRACVDRTDGGNNGTIISKRASTGRHLHFEKC